MFELCDLLELLGVPVLGHRLELIVLVVNLSDCVLKNANGVVLLVEFVFQVLNLHLSLLEDGQLVLELFYSDVLLV